MPTNRTGRRSHFEWLRRRYEDTEKKCPECGYVDEDGNWESRTDGQQVVYHHVCPSCRASREHTFRFDR